MLGACSGFYLNVLSGSGLARAASLRGRAGPRNCGPRSAREGCRDVYFLQGYSERAPVDVLLYSRASRHLRGKYASASSAVVRRWRAEEALAFAEGQARATAVGACWRSGLLRVRYARKNACLDGLAPACASLEPSFRAFGA